MFLQKQLGLHKKDTKKSTWLDRILFPDSIDIKFSKFGRVDQKLCNLQIQSTYRNVSVYLNKLVPRVMFLLDDTGSHGLSSVDRRI